MTGPRMSMSARNMARLIEKWKPMLAEAEARGDQAQAQNWREAIEAAEVILKRSSIDARLYRLRGC